MTRRQSVKVLVLIFPGFTLSYVDRMFMTAAIPCIGKDLHLTRTVMGLVMSAFFVV